MSRELPIRPEILPELTEAVELRIAGYSYRAIAERQGVSVSTAHGRVQAAMLATLQEPTDELRRIERERLDRLFGAMYEIAVVKGSARHAEIASKLMERRAKLLGLDAPERRVVNVYTDDSFDVAIRELEAQLAENDPHPGERGDSGVAGEGGALLGAQAPVGGTSGG